MKVRASARCCQRNLSASAPKKLSAQPSAKNSMLIECTSQASSVGQRLEAGRMLRAR